MNKNEVASLHRVLHHLYKLKYWDGVISTVARWRFVHQDCAYVVHGTIAGVVQQQTNENEGCEHPCRFISIATIYNITMGQHP